MKQVTRGNSGLRPRRDGWALRTVLAGAGALLLLPGSAVLAQEAEQEAEQEAVTDTVPEVGLQGSPNPLQRNDEILSGRDLTDESFPNSIPIPGSDVRFRIGGYAKLDYIQDLDYVGDRFTDADDCRNVLLRGSGRDRQAAKREANEQSGKGLGRCGQHSQYLSVDRKVAGTKVVFYSNRPQY